MSKVFKVKDPNQCGDGVVDQFDNIDDAIKCAETVLSEYRKQSYDDGEWPFETDSIIVLNGNTVVAQATECNVIECPDDVDEDGYSPSEELYFIGVDRYCDYKIVCLETALKG